MILPLYLFSIRPIHIYILLNTRALACLISLVLCICVSVIQSPGTSYIMFSNFYSFAGELYEFSINIGEKKK